MFAVDAGGTNSKATTGGARASHKRRYKSTCIDLFAGCGGLSLGATQAGFELVGAVECDRHASASYKANFPNVRLAVQDIKTINPNIFGHPKADIIVAGPPCQSFSASNQRSRGPDHPNNRLYTEALRFIFNLRPSAALFENVEGFGIGGSKEYAQDLMNKLRALGYIVQHKTFCASDFGVPQARRRMIITATQFDFDIDFRISNRSYANTVKDAIEDLPFLQVGASVDNLPYKSHAMSNYAKKLRGNADFCSGHLVTNNAQYVVDRYTHISEGGNWRDIPDNLMSNYANANRCHTGIYHRLRNDQPAKVIGNFRKNMLIHPTEHRGLSIREAARLQSFPDAFRFFGSIGKQQQQVGNAVPPMLATAVLTQLKDAMEISK